MTPDNWEAYETIMWILDHADMGFFIVTAPHNMQREIAELYVAFDKEIFDYAEKASSWSYPELNAWEESHPDTDFLFILNMQLALKNENDMLSFNLCRDMLSAKQRVWVFFMTKDLDRRLSTFALDFYSFVRLKANFEPDEIDMPVGRLYFDGFDRLFNFDQSKEALDRYKELEQEYTSLSLDDTPDDRLIAAAISLSNISDLHKNCAEYSEALVLLDIVKNINEKLYGNNHTYTTSTYGKIAEVYALQGDFTRALELYNTVLSTYEQELGHNDVKTGGIYVSIGLTYDGLGDYNEALSWYMKALEICENDEALKYHTATVYSNIALAYSKQGEYSTALEWYEKALDIHERVGDDDSVDVATLYKNIAAAHAYQGNHTTAQELNMKALSIYEKYHGAEHPITAEIYNNIGFVFLNQGNYPSAIEWFSRALAIYEKRSMEKHPTVATTYNNIAFAYKGQQDYSSALKWCLKSYIALINNLGNTHPISISVKENLKGIYINIGFNESFEQWLQKSLY